jgi:acetyltransferase-like isoleucine patch superfamily enzyme
VAGRRAARRRRAHPHRRGHEHPGWLDPAHGPGLSARGGQQRDGGPPGQLHGCTIGDGSLIGIQVVIYNKAVLGRDCLVGLGSIVTEGKVFADRSLIVGVPGKRIRECTDADVAFMHANTKTYVDRRERYRALTAHRLARGAAVSRAMA